MSATEAVALAISAALFAYLMYALLRAEDL